MHKRKMKFIFYLAIIIFAIYTSTLERYSELSLFQKLFSAPFAEIILIVSELFGGRFWIGLIASILVGEAIYTPILIRSDESSKRLQENKDLMDEIRKLPNTTQEERELKTEKMIEFMSEKKINPFAPFVLFLIIPFFILRFRGMLSIPFTNAAFNELNFKFLWLNLKSYDPYLILTILIVLVLIFKPLLVSKKEKERNKEIKEKNPLSKHMNRFVTFIYLLLIAISLTSATFSVYFLINTIVSLTFRKYIIKKERKDEQNNEYIIQEIETEPRVK